MTPESFPVVDERPLLPPERRWFRRPWRDPALLPALLPGCVYVFATNSDTFTVCADPDDLRGTEPDFVNAKWASMVNTRYRQITTTAWIPGKEPPDDLVVTALFGCKVDNPVEAAKRGPVDLQQHLDTQFRLNKVLLEIQHRFSTEKIETARTMAPGLVRHVYKNDPPIMEGVRITLEGVYLHTPGELRHHYAEVRDTIWAREVEALRERYELDRVAHTEKLLTSAERAQAAAIARQETNTLRAADRAFQERADRTQHLVDQVEKWLDTDSGKRALIDRRHLAEELFAQLTGKRLPVELAHAHRNGRAEPKDDGPRLPPPDRISPA
jgi:hypothetical protein